MMAAGGFGALEWESRTVVGRCRPRAWLRTKANSIEGGTSEVQLNIIAKRILDLPGASAASLPASGRGHVETTHPYAISGFAPSRAVSGDEI